MGFQGRDISGNDYSIIDVYQASNKIDQLNEKMATRQRQYRLQSFENEFRMGYIGKGDWYTKQIVDLQKMYEEETDSYQSLKIQNNIMQLQDTKARYDESQFSSADAVRKSNINEWFKQTKQFNYNQDIEYAEKIGQIETATISEEAKAIGKYKLYQEYFEILTERKEDPAVQARLALDDELGQTVGQTFIKGVDKDIQIWNGEGSITIGNGGDLTSNYKIGKIDEIRDQVNTVKGITLNVDGTMDETESFKDENELTIYEGDGSYVTTFEDGEYNYVPKETLTDKYILGPGELSSFYADDAGNAAEPADKYVYYKKNKEEFKITDKDTGAVKDAVGGKEYIETIGKDGATTRILKNSDGTWNWGHMMSDVPFGERERGLWALGYDDADDMGDVVLTTDDGRESTKWYSDEEIIGAAKDVTDDLARQGPISPFDGMVIRDPDSNEVYVINNGRKTKITKGPQEIQDRFQLSPDNILEDTTGILMNYEPEILDINTPESQSQLLEEPINPIQDDVFKFKKADGGFDFFEVRGTEKNPIDVAEFAQRKGITPQEALAGSENEQDLNILNAPSMQDVSESFLGVGQSGPRSQGPTRPGPLRFGAPKGRGIAF